MKDYGCSKETIYIHESWWNQYCYNSTYHNCSHLSAARQAKELMKREESKQMFAKPKTGAKNKKAKTPQNNYGYSAIVSHKTGDKQKQAKKRNPVHATGGIPPHFCEKPWRDPDLRLLICNSYFYNRPWMD